MKMKMMKYSMDRDHNVCREADKEEERIIALPLSYNIEGC